MKFRKNQSGFSVVEVLLLLIFLAVVAFAGYYVYHAQKTSSKTNPKTSTVKEDSQATTKTTETPAPQYINYRDAGKDTGGIKILASSDVAKLTGASANLKAYFAAALPNTTCTSDDPFCSAGDVIVKNTVASTYGDFAAVYVPDAYEVVGPDPVSGNIVKIWGGQQAPLCSSLQQNVVKYKIPSGFYSQDSFFSCYPDGNGTSSIPYTSYNR